MKFEIEHKMKKIALSLFVIALMTMTQSYAQSKSEESKQEQASKVASLLSQKRYKFIATRALTSLPGKSSVELMDKYDLSVTPDTIKSQLPFYGYSTSPMMGSTESPLFFESTNFTYEQQNKQRGQRNSTLIKMEAKSKSRLYTITLDVQANGSSTLTIRNNDLSNTTFWGQIE